MAKINDYCLEEAYQPKPQMLEPWQLWICTLPNEHDDDPEAPKRRPIIIVDPYYDEDDLDEEHPHYPEDDFYPDVIRGTSEYNKYKDRIGVLALNSQEANALGLNYATVFLVYKLIEYIKRGQEGTLSAKQIYEEGGYLGKLDKSLIDEIKYILKHDDKYTNNGIAVEDLNMNSESKSEKIYDFIEDIYDLRKESIANEGEFGLGNLVFKEFRNLGYLDALKALTKVLKGRELSLENINEDFSHDTLQSIYDYTLDNDGGTFDLKTGKSLSGEDVVKNVYSVEFKSEGWNKRMPQVNKDAVFNAIETLLRSELVKDADAIGTWSSAKDERPQSSVGLDKFFKDREEAEKFALEHDQDAIGVFDNEGKYSDTIYKRDFKYKPHKEEEPKEEPKVEPQEQDKEEK